MACMWYKTIMSVVMTQKEKFCFHQKQKHNTLACSTDFRLDYAKILLSNIYDSDAGNPDPSLASWNEIYTFPTPAQNYYTRRLDAAESARHIAIFNPTAHSVTLREVFVEAVCQDGESQFHVINNQFGCLQALGLSESALSEVSLTYLF